MNQKDSRSSDKRRAMNQKDDRYTEANDLIVEGRNPVLEAIRANEKIDKLFVQEGLKEGAAVEVTAKAAKAGIQIHYVPKNKLDKMSRTGRHQGVILQLSAVEYADVDEILEHAVQKGEPPFVFLLDGIEDPHNLGAIIRTAHVVGAHGVIIPKHRAASLTATVSRASAGALWHIPIARVTNIAKTIDELKEKGMWFVCADMSGQEMYDVNMTGSIGLVIGNEGSGVSRLVKEKCDFTARIPMKGKLDSLNASVAAAVLAYEIYRQNR